MLFIRGKRTARIKRFTDHQQSCSACKTFALTVSVYREYYHAFFIPVIPVGDKTVTMRCSNCGEPLRSESLQKQHAAVTRTPFYLYSLLWLVVAMIVAGVGISLNTQRNNKAYVNNPQPGDVYMVSTDSSEVLSGYYFFRVGRVKGDSVFVYPNHYKYLSSPSALEKDDFFSKEAEMGVSKKELLLMLEKDRINYVDRGYGDETGYNRVQ